SRVNWSPLGDKRQPPWADLLTLRCISHKLGYLRATGLAAHEGFVQLYAPTRYPSIRSLPERLVSAPIDAPELTALALFRLQPSQARRSFGYSGPNGT